MKAAGFETPYAFARFHIYEELNRPYDVVIRDLRSNPALLEAMSERQVTTDGETRRLGPPFLVVATQNPHEFEGTYPLPESQLDRFLLRVKVGYPDRAAERAILTQHREGEPVESLKPVLHAADVLALQAKTRAVAVSEPIADYALNIVQKTRERPDIVLAASTRAALALYRAAQANALLDGREFTVPDDVKRMAEPVLAHRLVTKGWSATGPADAAPIVREILKQVEAPK